MTPSHDRRNEDQRLTRVESDVVWIKDIVGRMADDVSEIKISQASEKGGRAMLRYVGHGIVVAAGAVAGFLGGGIRHP